MITVYVRVTSFFQQDLYTARSYLDNDIFFSGTSLERIDVIKVQSFSLN